MSTSRARSRFARLIRAPERSVPSSTAPTADASDKSAPASITLVRLAPSSLVRLSDALDRSAPLHTSQQLAVAVATGVCRKGHVRSLPVERRSKAMT